MVCPRRRKLAACPQFKIHNSLPVPFVPPVSLVPPVPAPPILPAFSPVPLVPPVPLVLLVPLVSPVPALPIHPAFSTLSPVPLVPQFKIPLALFRAHYRLEKLFSLWCIKENSRAILLYCIDC